MILQLTVPTVNQGLVEITGKIEEALAPVDIVAGLCTIFIQHTSASLIIQENADPSVKTDIENWLDRLVPENDPLYTHTSEGPDDMPAHLKSLLTQSTLSIPVENNSLSLGTWQGIYLFEHRNGQHNRHLKLHIQID